MTDSEKLDLLIREMKDMKTEMKDMKTEMKGINTRLNTVETKLDTVERRTKSIELTLENEISPSIKRIAEAHLDLNRKFDKALELKKADELRDVKIIKLENDVRQIKEVAGL